MLTEKKPVLHRRQFLIASKPISYRPDWLSVELGPACHLSFCPSLPVRSVADADGNRWHLLGIAVQTNPDRPDPEDEIARNASRKIPELYQSWAGRWVLIGDGSLHLDASGFIGCYYFSQKASIDREIPWASSSPALLAELAGDRAGTRDPRRLSYRVGIEWFPPPRSEFPFISRLLLSQVLHLEDRTVGTRRLFSALEPPLEYETVLQRLEGILSTFLRRMPAGGRNIWATLTAGFDSRVILAAIVKSGIPARTFTQGYREIPVANLEPPRSISIADRLLPPKLSAAVGLEHLWVPWGRVDRRRQELFDAHTLGNVVDIQRHFFSSGQWDFVQEGDLVLGGLCFEIGRCYFWKKLGDSAFVTNEAIATGYHEDPDSSLMQAMAEWIQWANDNPHEGIDWRDRFYIEQRMGGWQSAREQSMDLVPADLLHPMNCHDAHALSLSVPVEMRARGQHQLDLVRRMAPELMDFPVNPDYRHFHPLTRIFWNWKLNPLYPMKALSEKVSSLLSSAPAAGS